MSTPSTVDPDTLNRLFFDAQKSHQNGRLEEAEKAAKEMTIIINGANKLNRIRVSFEIGPAKKREKGADPEAREHQYRR